MPILWNKLLIVLFLLVVNVSFSQEKNPTVYPYGGVPDSSRYQGWMKEENWKVPLSFRITRFEWAEFNNWAEFGGAKFYSRASFAFAKFHSRADFREVEFHYRADFEEAKFISNADFGGANFNSEATFFEAKFNGLANFWKARVYSQAEFGEAQFDCRANFKEAEFHSWAEFEGANFDSLADFREVQFNSLANFKEAESHIWADFTMAQFDSLADFRMAKFHGWTDFKEAQFKDKIDFKLAVLNDKIDFRGAHIDSIVDFSLAEIKDTVLVGIEKSSELQNYDFMRATLLEAGIDTIKAASTKGIPQKNFHYPGAKIVIYGPVDLKIQLEKFKFLALYDKLDYYSKKDIISTLKQVSFKGSEYQKERFELDYIFDRSTMYQKQSPNYEVYSAFNPICWGQFLYNITMGLGYRPFRLAWWVLGFIIGFGIFYFFKMRDSINGYILKKFEMKESSGTKRKKDVNQVSTISHTESLMNCLYFSSTLLFSFRLKGEILTFFNLKEKRYIVGEYLLGLLIYIAFLTLAKSGSILHNLKSLFVG